MNDHARSRGGINHGLCMLRGEEDVFSENKRGAQERHEDIMIESNGRALMGPADSEDKRPAERKRTGQRRSAVLFAALAGSRRKS